MAKLNSIEELIMSVKKKTKGRLPAKSREAVAVLQVEAVKYTPGRQVVVECADEEQIKAIARSHGVSVLEDEDGAYHVVLSGGSVVYHLGVEPDADPLEEQGEAG